MKDAEKNLPNIYEYNDFRKYLRDYQEKRQAFDKTFTKSYFSKVLGLPNTRSFFTDVLAGKTVTSAFVERFVSVLNLNTDEAQFFNALVRFNQAENTNERELFFEQLILLNKTPKKILDKKLFVFYKNWYNSVVRALLDVDSFGDDYAALAKRVFPPITPKQAKQIIKLLRDLKIIEKNEKGYYKPVQRSIATPDFVKDELVRQYQLSCLEMSKLFLIKNRSFPYIMNTNMISISKNGYKRLEKLIEKFRSQVRSLVHKDEEPAEKVYLLSTALIPASKKGGKE